MAGRSWVSVSSFLSLAPRRKKRNQFKQNKTDLLPGDAHPLEAVDELRGADLVARVALLALNTIF